MSVPELWQFLPLGYVLSILIEAPVLVIGLSKRHPLRRRLLAGVWLTACTYPVVVLVLPLLLADFSRATYLLIAETFAPVVECLLFWMAFGTPDLRQRFLWVRDFSAIVVANLASFVAGEIMNAYNWFGYY